MDAILTFLYYTKEFFIVILLGVILYFSINIGNRFIEENKKIKITKKVVFNFLLFLILLLSLYQLYKISSSLFGILMPFFYSIIIAYLLNPLITVLEKRNISTTLSVLLVYLFIIAVILILSFSLVPNVVNEFKKLVDLLPTYFNQLYEFFNKLYINYSKNIENLPPEFQSINEVFRENLNNIQTAIINTIKNMTNGILNIFSKAFSLIIIPIATFYFLKDKNYFKKKVILLIPKAYRTDILKVSREIDLVLGKFIRGQLIVAAFVGISTAVGLLLLGIDFALIIGVVAGVANIIPYFGPIIGIIPAIIFALLESPSKVLWVVILFTIIQQFESNILSPKIVGESVGLHPLLVIISLLIGGSYFGVVGMLLAVPTAAVLKIISLFVIEKIFKF